MNMPSDSVNAVCCWNAVQCLAFHDDKPQAPIHFIVIPKRPIGPISRCDEADKQVIGWLQCDTLPTFNVCSEKALFCELCLSLCFNGHFPGEPGLASVYCSKG